MTGRIRLLPVVLRLLVVILVAAAAFGLWHVIVGGLINGNPRAASFGAALAAVSAALAGGVVAAGRRIRRA